MGLRVASKMARRKFMEGETVRIKAMLTDALMGKFINSVVGAMDIGDIMATMRVTVNMMGSLMVISSKTVGITVTERKVFMIRSRTMPIT